MKAACIHNNPSSAGLCSAKDWEWSSYREYIGDARITSTSLALGMPGSKEAFEDFHAHPDLEECTMEKNSNRRTLCDEDAKQIAKSILGPEYLFGLGSLKRSERDVAIGQLKGAGLGVRQIQRLAGISLGVISKA